MADKFSFFIERLGCSKNSCDADVIYSCLIERGWREVKLNQADLIIVNTCGFIESAKEESIEAFFQCLKTKKQDAKIVLSGCLAQRYYKSLNNELKEADFILGNYDIKEILSIAKIIENKSPYGKKVFGVDESADNIPKCYSSKHILYDQNHFKGPVGYIKIAEGCTHCCSFCAIPIIRGTLCSQSEEKLIESIKMAVDGGAKEINLVAQDLINYGKDRSGKTEIYSLLEKICAISGNFKVRMLYIHPDFFELELVKFIHNHSYRLIPYFDIPFQHSSTAILRSMGRTGDKDKYLRLIDDIRRIEKESIIRSTFMLGYPLETKKSINELKEFIRLADLDYSGFFIYSKEEGTPAFNLESSVLSKKYLNESLEEMKALQEEISDKRFSRFVKSQQYALIEDVTDDTYISRIWAQAEDVDGLTFFDKCTSADRKYNKGDIVKVRILANDSYDLYAQEIN